MAGCASAAPELARWSRSGVSPASAAVNAASVKASTALAVADGCASLARARCDHTPTTRTAPNRSYPAAARHSRSQAAGSAPLRERPVSTSRCSRAVMPRARASATIASRSDSVEHPQLDTQPDGRGQVAERIGQPGDHPRHDARRPQRQRFVDRRHAEGRGPRQQGGAGDLRIRDRSRRPSPRRAPGPRRRRGAHRRCGRSPGGRRSGWPEGARHRCRTPRERRRSSSCFDARETA